MLNSLHQSVKVKTEFHRRPRILEMPKLGISDQEWYRFFTKQNQPQRENRHHRQQNEPLKLPKPFVAQMMTL